MRGEWIPGLYLAKIFFIESPFPAPAQVILGFHTGVPIPSMHKDENPEKVVTSLFTGH